jgi:hypothetical protein
MLASGKIKKKKGDNESMESRLYIKPASTKKMAN